MSHNYSYKKDYGIYNKYYDEKYQRLKSLGIPDQTAKEVAEHSVKKIKKSENEIKKKYRIKKKKKISDEDVIKRYNKLKKQMEFQNRSK